MGEHGYHDDCLVCDEKKRADDLEAQLASLTARQERLRDELHRMVSALPGNPSGLTTVEFAEEVAARQVELEGWLETADRERGELKEELLKAGPLRLEIERLRRALERICAYTFESDRGAYNLAQAALSADQEGK